MREEFAAYLRREARSAVDAGQRSVEELAQRSDLAVTTLRRFLDDGELSTPALVRLSLALGVFRRVQLDEQARSGGVYSAAG